MNILIAPVGNIERYEEVTYVIENTEKKSKVSFSILEEIKKTEKIIIIALDTLADKGKNYEEIEEDVKNKIFSFIKKEKLLKSENLDVMVAPGVGRFSGNKIFKGNMRDYYSFLFYHLSKIFLEGDEPLEIYLDLSHGINYMPVLTYQAIKEAGALVAIKREVKLETYNSDPVTGKPSIDDKFQINMVNEEIIEFTIKKYSDSRIQKFRQIKPINENYYVDNEKRREFDKEFAFFQQEAHEILAFLGAVFHGLLLPIFRFYPDIENIEKRLEHTFKKWRDSINLTRKNEELICERKLTFTEFFEVLVKALVLARCLNLERKEVVQLSEVEELFKNFFAPLIVGNFIDDEIRTFREVKEKNIEDWKPLIEIKMEGSGKKVQPASPHQRNFFAHAGFEGNAVMVKKEGDSLLIKYNEKFIEIIKNYCCEGIRCLKKTFS